MIYTIQNDGIVAKIDSLGATLISLTCDGVEYIWQKDPKYWVGSAPILFPVIAKVRDGIITVDGKVYPMTKHGFVRDAEHELIKQSESKLVFRYSSCDRTREMYPWEFDFDTTFTLQGGVLETEYKIHNADKSDMYFCVGGHPAFNVPLGSSESFEDWQIEFEKEEPLYTNPMVGDEIQSKAVLVQTNGRILPLKRNLFNSDALVFDNIKSKSVKLCSAKTGKGVEVSYPDFNTLAVWTQGEPSDAPYVCIEPWLGMGYRDDETSDLKAKHGVQTLAAGQYFAAAFKIRII